MPPNFNAAKKALRQEESCASVCVAAVNLLHRQHWLLWEPETLWLELDREGVDVPVGNRGQIMAARNLVTSGRYWYDAHAFSATCIEFNNEEALHVGIERAPVAYINWTVYEAEIIYRDLMHESTLPAIDREPLMYTVVQLHDEGFIWAPAHLKYAQTELNKTYPREVDTLRYIVQKGWAAAPRGKELNDAAFPETPAGVQLARLASVQRYLDDRIVLREKQLAALNS